MRRKDLVCRLGVLIWLFFFAGIFSHCRAQSKLSLREAVDRALDSRASLKAEAERISAARGLQKQAALIPNPTFQFENQNLRAGQTYNRDVDTYAYLTQPLDVLGKRTQRITVAGKQVGTSAAQYELARRQVAQSVKQSYWPRAARRKYATFCRLPVTPSKESLITMLRNSVWEKFPSRTFSASGWKANG